MATIQCKACGKHYSYEKEGCCPNCGAYNRRPKRERVNADGTIQHMTDAAYEKRSKAAGKVCFEEKECYEEKVCYEDQARHGHRKEQHSTGQAMQGLAAFLNQLTAAGNKGGKKKSKGHGALGAVLVVILAILAGTNTLDRVFDGGNSYEEDPGPGSVAVAPADEDHAVDHYDVAMAEEVTMEDGTTFTVWAWEWHDEEKELVIFLEASFAEDSDHGYTAVLTCTNTSGGEEILTATSTVQDTDGNMEIHFAASRQNILRPAFLELQEWEHGDVVLTRIVDLQ